MELSAYKFLIVDDHMLARRAIIAELTKFGAKTVDEASNGVEGLEKINQKCAAGEPYDIIFLDWAMPEMNGNEVLKACRANDELKNMSIIMVSAESEDVNILKALEAGATAYIAKPFQPELLAHKLDDVLGWRAGKPELDGNG